MGACGEPEVDIALATYNGEKYLAEQLASIERQEGVSWRLVTADDGSTDGTARVLEVFRERHGDRVVILPPAARRLGPSAAFGRVLHGTTAPYVALCDQDDVWLPSRLSATLGRLRQVEAEIGPRPVLVHSDLRVVDERLRTIAPSLDRFQVLGARSRTRLRHLLVQNSVTGCAATVNRALVERALPIPTEAIMHDWWLALVAAVFGRVAFVPQQLVMYRQHGANTLGARRFAHLAPLGGPAGLRTSLERTFVQAGAIANAYGAVLPADALATCSGFASLGHHNAIARRLRVVRGGYWKHGFLRNVVMLLVI